MRQRVERNSMPVDDKNGVRVRYGISREEMEAIEATRGNYIPLSGMFWLEE